MRKFAFVAAILSIFQLTGCDPEAQGPDAAAQTVELGLRLELEDGAGVMRRVEFERASLDDATGALVYEARVDGEARQLSYLRTDEGLSVRATAGELDDEVELLVLDDSVELGIGGVHVGSLGRGVEAQVVTEIKADELSFALLSFFPHQRDGLRPAELFGDVGATREAPEGLEQSTQGLFGIHLGGANLACKKVKIRTYACDQQGTQTPEGCSGGSACGPILCCVSGCRIDESTKFEYGGGVSL